MLLGKKLMNCFSKQQQRLSASLAVLGRHYAMP